MDPKIKKEGAFNTANFVYGRVEKSPNSAFAKAVLAIDKHYEAEQKKKDALKEQQNRTERSASVSSTSSWFELPLNNWF